MHGDVHARNAFVDSWDRARLGNYGLCLFSEGAAYNYASIRGGSAIRWTAPEILNPVQFGLTSNQPTFQSDMYAFGMTLIEVSIRSCEYCSHFVPADCLSSRYTRVKNPSTSSIQRKFENAS